MKKIKYFIGLLLFVCFLPNVNALTYDINTEIKKINNMNNYEINISLSNIKNTSDGIFACSMVFDYSDGVVLNGNIETEDSWNMTKGEIYLFDTATPILKNGKILKIPVKVSKNGKVIIKNISCSDGVDEVKISDKSVNLTYSTNNSDNNSSTGSSDNVDSNPQTGVKFSIYIIILICVVCGIVSLIFVKKKMK